MALQRPQPAQLMHPRALAQRVALQRLVEQPRARPVLRELLGRPHQVRSERESPLAEWPLVLRVPHSARSPGRIFRAPGPGPPNY